MRFLRVALLGLLPFCGLFAQLSETQKMSDFLQLAGLYDVNYAPYEWKLQNFGFDLLKVDPWLAQAENSKTDLDFYDVMVRYVASLKDDHDEFLLPSDFSAYLHFSADMYDGNALIDNIDRSYLPVRKYPFQIGDQLVSVDGVSVQDLLAEYLPYAVNGHGNPVLEQRSALLTITLRQQAVFPQAAAEGDSAAVVIQRKSGDVETYTIPWDKQGVPITQAANIPVLQMRSAPASPVSVSQSMSRQPARLLTPYLPAAHRPASLRLEGNNRAAWGAWTYAVPEAAAPQLPQYMAPLAKLRQLRAYSTSVMDVGRFTPMFNPPSGFHLRLGSSPGDAFLSGTFSVGSDTIGLIRIPTFEPLNQALALGQFASEIAYFEKNTSALVVDVMHNGGGDPCYGESLMTYLVPSDFYADGEELRATLEWQQSFGDSIILAKEMNADPWVTDLYNAYLKELQQALHENRGMTGPLPVCGPSLTALPAQDTQGNMLAYTKPIVLLTDSFTFSAAEVFAAYLQDANRVTQLGERTAGAGGALAEFDAGVYSEGATRVTISMVTREQPAQNPGFPASLYIENTGVMPGIPVPWNTTDNLLHGGKTFVNAFISAVQDLIQE